MESDCSYNEKETLKLIASGNQRAFAEMVQLYSAVVYSHILTYIKSPLRAEELTQDVFMRIWKHREELPQIHNFKGYLFVLTRNCTISAFRQKIVNAESIEKKDIIATDPNPHQALEYNYLAQTLSHGIQLLPQRRKQVFTMSRVAGRGYEEIARELGISKSSVNQHIVAALAFLRAYLKKASLPLLMLFF